MTERELIYALDDCHQAINDAACLGLDNLVLFLRIERESIKASLADFDGVY